MSEHDDAVAVVKRLRDAGHVAYFAGGCVRDRLLGLAATDYDVATDAPPGRVREVFPNTQAVGAAFGLTPSRYQSGGINRTRAISRCGDEMMRMIMLVRTAKWSWLKAWAIKIAGTAG